MAYDNNNFETPNASTTVLTLFGDVSMINMQLFNDRFSFSFAAAATKLPSGRCTYDTAHKYTTTLSWSNARTLVNAYDRLMKKDVEEANLLEAPVNVSIVTSSAKHGYVRHILEYGELDQAPAAKYIVYDNLDESGYPTETTTKHEMVFKSTTFDISVNSETGGPDDSGCTIAGFTNADFLLFIDMLRSWINATSLVLHAKRNADRFPKRQNDQQGIQDGYGQRVQNSGYQRPNYPAQQEHAPAGMAPFNDMPVGDDLPYTGGDGFFN